MFICTYFNDNNESAEGQRTNSNETGRLTWNESTETGHYGWSEPETHSLSLCEHGFNRLTPYEFIIYFKCLPIKEFLDPLKRLDSNKATAQMHDVDQNVYSTKLPAFGVLE